MTPNFPQILGVFLALLQKVTKVTKPNPKQVGQWKN